MKKERLEASVPGAGKRAPRQVGTSNLRLSWREGAELGSGRKQAEPGEGSSGNAGAGGSQDDGTSPSQCV